MDQAAYMKSAKQHAQAGLAIVNTHKKKYKKNCLIRSLAGVGLGSCAQDIPGKTKRKSVRL